MAVELGKQNIPFPDLMVEEQEIFQINRVTELGKWSAEYVEYKYFKQFFLSN